MLHVISHEQRVLQARKLMVRCQNLLHCPQHVKTEFVALRANRFGPLAPDAVNHGFFGATGT
jgi:hypothetical protein